MNHLKNQTSPYLLQHADNPVDWFPWCEEAFSLAEKENKPIFLSIGYSTCHWCHVMAQESFEDEDAKTDSHGRQNEHLEQEASAGSEKESAFFQDLLQKAYQMYALSFDKKYGGFGTAPKFPTPHHYLFLMRYYEKTGETNALQMAEKSLYRMYLGGLFDHIGGGFCRYSTDQSFLVPHFEKMLYDNALLISAYCKVYQLTKKECYLEAAKKTADYILREMTDTEGGFYSAQDADSEGEEGKYYLFKPSEIKEVLGEKDGEAFNRYYDITEKGNFAGKSIPNLLKQDRHDRDFSASLEKLYHYRKNRYQLHTDDKILTGWNGLMIAALSDYLTPPDQVTIVPDGTGLPKELSCKIPPDTIIRILESPNEEYPLKDHKTTFYICRNFQCNPPVNQIDSSTFFAD